MHALSSELTIDRPLRLLSDLEADAILGPWQAMARDSARLDPSDRPDAVPTQTVGESSSCSDALGSDRAPAMGGGGGMVVLVGTQHVLVRTRCTAHVAVSYTHLTLPTTPYV